MVNGQCVFQTTIYQNKWSDLHLIGCRFLKKAILDLFQKKYANRPTQALQYHPCYWKSAHVYRCNYLEPNGKIPQQASIQLLLELKTD